MKEQIKELVYGIEGKLKELCGEITPDKRLTVIIIMLLLFTILNLYFTITTIKNWGKEQERQEQLKIEHIKQLDLETKPKTFDLLDSDIEMYQLDSIYNEKTNNQYGG